MNSSADHQNLRAILWMVFACLMASIMITLVRYIGDEVHVTQIVFLRYLFAVMFFLPWCIKVGKAGLRSASLPVHFLRSITGVCGMFAWFYVLMKIPLADATALSFTAPLLTGVLAVFFLGETMGVRRICAMLLAFMGVLIVLQPGTEMFSPYAVLAIGTAALWSVSGVLVKHLSATDSPQLIAFYMVAMMCPVCLPFALYYWQPIAPSMWAWLVLLGFVSNLFQVSLSRAISMADLVVTMPFDFLRLLFVAVFAAYFFDESLGMHTMLGALLIFAAAVYSTWRQKRRSTPLCLIDKD